MINAPKKILFATDLSKECQQSYIMAVHLAMALNGSITLLHVIEDLPISLEDRVKKLFGEHRFDEIMEEHENDARNILIAKRKDSKIILTALSKFCEESKENNPEFLEPDEILVKKGKVVDEILSTAHEIECDMIILSPHESSLPGTLISQTIKEVVKASTIPTFIIPPPKNPAIAGLAD
ncbi:universal stress protein [Desulfosarcina variabilis str. Montpellier]|uniref:universal stress protein n=1 Tax=Desulfosarcina variabilis TaxID=2300 RepID=UPI003AFAF2C5